MKRQPTHRLRSMRIERHHDKHGKVTGHTVHHEMEPVRRASKSGAFIEGYHTESYPFGAGDHKGMIAHVSKHLGAMGESQADEGEE